MFDKIKKALGYEPGWKEYNEELREAAGGEYDFVREFPCDVVKAKGRVRPFSLELLVDSDCELRALTIPGVLPIFAGDRIIAYVDVGVTEHEIDNRGNETDRWHYVEGDVRRQEKPVKIDKLNADGALIASYVIDNDYE